jgi:hypothetical protein
MSENDVRVGTRVVCGYYYAHRMGHTISFGRTERSLGLDSEYEYEELRIEVLEGEGIRMSPDFGASQEAQVVWRNFVRSLGTGWSVLCWSQPPSYVRTEEDRWEYLCQAVRGSVKLRNVGAKGLAALTKLLRKHGKINDA